MSMKSIEGWYYSPKIGLYCMGKDESYYVKTQMILDFIKNIDRVFRDNDLEYLVHGGFVIGMFRNQKLIPWDDDMDVIVFDHEKLDSVIDQFEKYGMHVHKRYKNNVYAGYRLVLKQSLAGVGYNYYKCDIMLGCFDDDGYYYSVGNWGRLNHDDKRTKRDEMLPPVEYEIEGIMLPTFKEAQVVLDRVYGDLSMASKVNHQTNQEFDDQLVPYEEAYKDYKLFKKQVKKQTKELFNKPCKKSYQLDVLILTHYSYHKKIRKLHEMLKPLKIGVIVLQQKAGEFLESGFKLLSYGNKADLLGGDVKMGGFKNDLEAIIRYVQKHDVNVIFNMDSLNGHDYMQDIKMYVDVKIGGYNHNDHNVKHLYHNLASYDKFFCSQYLTEYFDGILKLDHCCTVNGWDDKLKQISKWIHKSTS